MKTTKKLLSTLLAIVMLFGVVSIVANAVSIDTTSTNYGYMLTTDAKISKAVSKVKVYGNHDYINFYIKSDYDDMYFFYEIYSDKKMTKLVASDYTYCKNRGNYNYTPWIKLKGKFNTGTYYGVTYAATIDGAGNATISEPSVVTFKLVVNKKPKYNQQMVILKSVTNTANGPTIKWYKLSSTTQKYNIYRRSLTGTKWTKVATVKGSVLSYTDKSIKDKNGKFVYTVRGIDKNGTLTRYHYSGLTCLFAKTPSVSSVATNYDNQIQVKWKSTAKSAVYNVYRKTDGGKWILIAKNFKGTTYLDKKTESGKNYRYTVRAVIPTEYGNAVSYYNNGKAVDFVGAPKLNPVKVVDNGLNITWGSVSGATAYTVYKKTLDKGAKWQSLGKVNSDVFTFTDTTANEDSSFIYTVRAEGKTSRGSYSGDGVMIVQLKAPKIVLHDYIEYSDTMRINIKNVPYALQYIVYYRVPGGEWTELNKFDVDKTYDFTLVQFKPEKYGELEYSVRAIRDDINYSDYSAPSKINAIPDISIYGIDNITEGNRITWNNIIAADKFEIHRAEIVGGVTGDFEYELIATVDGDKANTEKITYVDKTTEFGKKYSYIVKLIIDNEVITETSAKESVARLDMTNIKNTAKMLAVRGYDEAIEITDDNQDIVKKLYYQDSTGRWEVCGEVSGTAGSVPIQSYHVCDSKKNYRFSVVYVANGCESPIDENVFETRFPQQYIDIATTPVSNGVKVNFSIHSAGTHLNAKKFKVIYTEPQSGEKREVEFDSDDKGVGVTTLKTDVTVPGDINIDFIVYAYQSDTEAVRYENKITIVGIPELYKTTRNSDGTVNVYWRNTSVENDNFIVYRKAEGETKWKRINEFTYVEFTKTFNGVEYCGYTDKTAKPGVKYTYTVRALSETTDSLVSNSYYDKNGITTTK